MGLGWNWCIYIIIKLLVLLPLLIEITFWTPARWIRVYPPYRLSFLPSGSFLGIGSLVTFLKLSIALEAYVGLCVTEPNFWKKVFLLRKYGFLNLLEKLAIIFFWIWSIKKVCINCWILAQIPYFSGKSCSWDMSQNALDQSNCRIFKSIFISILYF